MSSDAISLSHELELNTPPTTSSSASSTYDTESLYTLTDSLREDLFRLKQGRKYQTLNEDYLLPADLGIKTELLCQEVHAKMWGNKIFYEPETGMVDRVLRRDPTEGRRRVLDLGSGLTAAWAIDMAERYPDAEVVGVDLVPAELSYYPPNLDLEIHDLLEGMPYPDAYFSMIHFRTLASVSNVVTPSFLAEIARFLCPGGVLLMEEPDLTAVFAPLPSQTHTQPFSVPWCLFSRPEPKPEPGSVANVFVALVRDRIELHFSTLRPEKPYVPTEEKGSHLVRREVVDERAYGRGEELAQAIRQTEGFIGGKEVRELMMESGIGLKEGEKPESSIGFLIRETILAAWSLGAASLEPPPSAEFLAQLTEIDGRVLPEQDVGLVFRNRVIFAVRA